MASRTTTDFHNGYWLTYLLTYQGTLRNTYGVNKPSKDVQYCEVLVSVSYISRGNEEMKVYCRLILKIDTCHWIHEDTVTNYTLLISEFLSNNLSTLNIYSSLHDRLYYRKVSDNSSSFQAVETDVTTVKIPGKFPNCLNDIEIKNFVWRWPVFFHRFWVRF